MTEIQSASKSDGTQSGSMPKRLKLVDSMVYGFSLLVMAVLTYLSGKEGFIWLREPNWTSLAISFLMTFLFVEVLALRYQTAMKFVYPKQTLSHTSALYGTSFGMTAGLVFSKGLGQLLGKPAVLKATERISFKRGFYISSLEKVVDLTQTIALVLPFVLLLQFQDNGFSKREGLALLGTISLALIPLQVLFLPKINRLMLSLALRVSGLVERLPWEKKSMVIANLQQLIEDPQGVKRDTALGLSLAALSLIKVFIMAGRIFFLGQAFSFPIPWELIVLGIPVVQLGLIIGVTPGGIGFLEGSWFIVFSIEQIPIEVVASFLLAFRITNFLFFPLITLLAGTLRRRSAKSI